MDRNVRLTFNVLNQLWSIACRKIVMSRILDKFVHFSMYASIGLVALLERRSHIHCNFSHLLLLGVIFAMSVLIELLQATVVATRSAEWLDLLANLTGLVAGFIAYRIIRSLRS